MDNATIKLILAFFQEYLKDAPTSAPDVFTHRQMMEDMRTKRRTIAQAIVAKLSSIP